MHNKSYESYEEDAIALASEDLSKIITIYHECKPIYDKNKVDGTRIFNKKISCLRIQNEMLIQSINHGFIRIQDFDDIVQNNVPEIEILLENADNDQESQNNLLEKLKNEYDNTLLDYCIVSIKNPDVILFQSVRSECMSRLIQMVSDGNDNDINLYQIRKVTTNSSGDIILGEVHF